MAAGGTLFGSTRTDPGTSITVTTLDWMVICTAASTRTVVLPVSPADGFYCRIKDGAGTAETNFITVTTQGVHGIDTSATTVVINTAYGEVDLHFDSLSSKYYIV